MGRWGVVGNLGVGGFVCGAMVGVVVSVGVVCGFAARGSTAGVSSGLRTAVLPPETAWVIVTGVALLGKRIRPA